MTNKQHNKYVRSLKSFCPAVLCLKNKASKNMKRCLYISDKNPIKSHEKTNTGHPVPRDHLSCSPGPFISNVLIGLLTPV